MSAKRGSRCTETKVWQVNEIVIKCVWFWCSNLFHRENPNDRSSKEIQHLAPATDFYKRLALDCSGQQIAVDLFVLNSQYCDLATLCKLNPNVWIIFTYRKVYHQKIVSFSKCYWLQNWMSEQFPLKIEYSRYSLETNFNLIWYCLHAEVSLSVVGYTDRTLITLGLFIWL